MFLSCFAISLSIMFMFLPRFAICLYVYVSVCPRCVHPPMFQIFTSNCSMSRSGQGEEMTCLSPHIPHLAQIQARSSTHTHQELPPQVKPLSLDLRLDLDNRDVLQDSLFKGGASLPRSIAVHEDPIFFQVSPDTEDAFVDVRNPIVTIRVG